MQECYHPDAVFSDPVFLSLSADEVKSMWEMLLTSSGDLKIIFSDIAESGNSETCHWEAFYTFSLTGRKVHNSIDATFVLRDGKIFRHDDHFDLWRWSGMAFGIPGLLFGWTPLMKNKIRAKARRRLDAFITRKRTSPS